jgi:hypothetical protein
VMNLREHEETKCESQVGTALSVDTEGADCEVGTANAQVCRYALDEKRRGIQVPRTARRSVRRMCRSAQNEGKRRCGCAEITER